MLSISLNSKDTKEIHRLLRKINIPSELLVQHLITHKDNPVLFNELAPLINYLKNHQPKQLFRFRSCTKQSINALSEGKLFLTRADYFNDPYDAALYFEPKQLQSQIESHISDENMISYLARHNFSKENIVKFMMVFHTKKTDYIDKLAEYFPLASKQLQVSSFIACFTECVNSPVMWAHYADQHKGFAIEYKFTPNIFYPQPFTLNGETHKLCGWRSLLPVLYTDKRVNGQALADWYCLSEANNQVPPHAKGINIIEALSDSLLHTKYSLNKSAAWSYEKEWRYMITHHWPHEVGNPTIHVLAKATAIYLGLRTPEEYKVRLAEIAQEKNIPIYEMYIDYTSPSYAMSWRPQAIL